METERIKEFIDLIKNTDIEELMWEEGDIKISIKRSDVPAIQKQVNKKSEDQEINIVPEKKFVSIKSPMVGTFYRAQSIDHPPLVIEGNHVVPGQKVAVIEAMKIMKDVISDVRGKIVKVLVENGQPVDYNRDLFLVDPEVNNSVKKSGGS